MADSTSDDRVGQPTWGVTASDIEAAARFRARRTRCEEMIVKHVLPLGHGHSTKMNAWVKSDPNTDEILEYRISCPCGALIVISGDEKRVEEDRAAFIGQRELEEIRKNFNKAVELAESNRSDVRFWFWIALAHSIIMFLFLLMNLASRGGMGERIKHLFPIAVQCGQRK